MFFCSPLPSLSSYLARYHDKRQTKVMRPLTIRGSGETLHGLLLTGLSAASHDLGRHHGDCTLENLAFEQILRAGEAMNKANLGETNRTSQAHAVEPQSRHPIQGCPKARRQSGDCIASLVGQGKELPHTRGDSKGGETVTNESKWPWKEHSVKLTFNKDFLAKQGITAPYYEDALVFPSCHEVALRYEMEQAPDSQE